MAIRFKTVVQRLDYMGNIHYLLIPATVVEQLGGSFSIRLWCSVNDVLKWQCGLVALGNGDAYISMNAQRLKKLRVSLGDELLVTLEKDESQYGIDVPEELNELFLQDPEGYRRFQTLVPGKQRFIIRFITDVKSSQLKIERAVTLIENLKRLPVGKEGFKEILGKYA